MAGRKPNQKQAFAWRHLLPIGAGTAGLGILVASTGIGLPIGIPLAIIGILLAAIGGLARILGR